MPTSIFTKGLPNGGLGTAPAAKPQVKAVFAEQITPTLQRLTYTTVDADSVDSPAKPDAGQQVTDVEFFKAPNPILADVEPATAEFGKGISVAAPGNVITQGGASMPLAPFVVLKVTGDTTTDHWKETVGGNSNE